MKFFHFHGMRALVLATIVELIGFGGKTLATDSPNLLLNGSFAFQSANSSNPTHREYRAGSIPFWDQPSYQDAEVVRAQRNGVFATKFPVDGVVVIHPGKSVWQFSLLSELALDPGDSVSLSVYGNQTSADSLSAGIFQMQLDDGSGSWIPAQFDQKDKRSFPRHARGELVSTEIGHGQSGTSNDFELKIENARIRGGTGPADENPLGLKVEFNNTSNQDIWIYSPCLVKGATARNQEPSFRALPEDYRYIPKTIAKLRRGEPLHIMIIGSSIDRRSSNPPLYLYDENPQSPHFKEPISSSDFLFDGGAVGHPEWTKYIGEWRHYFSYGGRLRLSLMRRFNYPIDKILLNFVACDGSSIGESHSALADWASLRYPPSPGDNGHKAGSSWAELYPSVLKKPGGPGPDLIIFGSGANETIDGPEEIAAFEGAIRWFQNHYPDVEFIFAMWPFREGPNAGSASLKTLALAYGIPYLDLAASLDMTKRYAKAFSSSSQDIHPQAAGHYLWSELLERALQPTDPIKPGFPQQYLPTRISQQTIGWEGEMTTYEAGSARIRQGKAFLFDDMVINLWASNPNGKVDVFVDGANQKDSLDNRSQREPQLRRDPRNSTFAIGALSLGDQHMVEITGAEARILAVDAKTALNRTWHGVESALWTIDPKSISSFPSQWGAPYGTSVANLPEGSLASLKWVGTACSVAWVSQENGGTLSVKIDGQEKMTIPTNEATTLASGEKDLHGKSTRHRRLALW